MSSTSELWQEGYWKEGKLVIGRRIEKRPTSVMSGTFTEGKLHGFGTLLKVASDRSYERYLGLWSRGIPGRKPAKNCSLTLHSYDLLF